MHQDSGQVSGSKDHFIEWREYFSSHIILIIIILAGLILIGVGCFFLFKSSSDDQDKIEIIPAAQETTSETIFADIEGAVVKHGVYELLSGSRINDLLIMAGGLSAKANRNWIEVNLNKAQKLKDGDKVYIPLAEESTITKETVPGVTTDVSSKININTASLAELDTLWGVGQITAQKIVDNRPYQKIEELVSKKIIPQSTFQKISNKLSVY